MKSVVVGIEFKTQRKISGKNFKFSVDPVKKSNFKNLKDVPLQMTIYICTR